MNPIAEAAKNLPGHWTKGTFHNAETGDRCGLGHLQMAAFGKDRKSSNNEYIDAANILNKVAIAQFPERELDSKGNIIPGFITFNDDPRTTEDEVVAVMEKAAVMWDERV